MSEVETIIEQARLFAVQHVPADVLSSAVPAALGMLVAGVGLSVLGAKLARFGLTAGFILIGGFLGLRFTQHFGFYPIVCILGGASLVGIIGYQTFRLWVGVGAAMVFSSIVLGTFGYQRVLPLVSEFEQSAQVKTLDSPVPFAIPTPQEQRDYLERTPQQWAGDFWAFVTQRDATVAKNAKAIALVALLTGLCMGIVAVRWALILATSLAGTVLVTTAMATLLTHSVPESYQAFQRNPALLGVGVGGFLVTSLILQTMLSRRTPAAKADGAKS